MILRRTFLKAIAAAAVSAASFYVPDLPWIAGKQPTAAPRLSMVELVKLRREQAMEDLATQLEGAFWFEAPVGKSAPFRRGRQSFFTGLADESAG